ncbi:SDR family NAD(P)-dependent oxidoreductase [candidate division TA06 bacterium]|nr:SDR family NAD(P)-dependent oxidoreductase [candidate division TA06 bacterium]
MKKAVIIGATSGIGKGLAEILAKNNYLVGITGRRKELLEKLKSETPERYFAKVIDVTDTINTIQLLEELAAELGGLDLLVISSGTGDLNDDLDFAIEKRTIETNVTGFTGIADWAFRYFEGQGSGHLAAISSIAGIRGSRQAPSYGATKAYQINYLEALRQKAARLKKPIYVSDIRPGFVDTSMAKGEGQFWVASVDKAAQQIFHAIKGKKKVAYITKRWSIIAIILKLLPNVVYDRI